MKTLTLITSVIFFILIALRCEDTSETSEVDVGSKPTDVKITAVKLFKDYESNEVAADEKYKNKILEVTGTIEDISVVLGQIFIDLKTGEYELTSIHCSFSDTHKSKIAKLRKGQSVTVKGRCTGMLLNLGITLEKCVIL